ncbi:hypothetical protein FRC09_015034 [Ceratobasidium sp. 395]|nr:hypothetical protein FRC09_015034 [Ceratobasidium sp. 395]
MRVSLVLPLFLSASLGGVLAAPTSEGSPATSEEPSEPSSSSREPSITQEPTSTRTTSTVEQLPTTSAAPPAGGGPNCVQECMAQAASLAGCSAFTDAECVCGNSHFFQDAQSCFRSQNCDPSAAIAAGSEYSSTCQNLSMSIGATSATDSTTSDSQPPITHNTASRTQPTSRSVPESTFRTVETYVIQSGAVITVSGAVYTANAPLTTTFSGQYGDFAGGYGVGTVGANDNGSSGTARPNSEVLQLALGRALPLTAVTLVVGVFVGGLCLAI